MTVLVEGRLGMTAIGQVERFGKGHSEVLPKNLSVGGKGEERCFTGRPVQHDGISRRPVRYDGDGTNRPVRQGSF